MRPTTNQLRWCGLLLAALFLCDGCSQPQGHGLWDLQVGSDARLVSQDGSDVVIEVLEAAPAGKRAARRSPRTSVQSVSLPSGTRVRVLAIDGDDARIEVEDGPRKNTALWVECGRLEAVEK